MAEPLSAAPAAALGWTGTSLPVVWGWTLAALSSAFMAVRLGVYALLVSIAWVRIIEEDGLHGRKYKRKPVERHKHALTQAALHAHDSEKGSEVVAAAGASGHSPANSVQSLADSMDDWSIWEGDSEEEGSASQVAPACPITPTAAGRQRAVITPLPPQPAASSISARPHVQTPVTVAAMPTPASQQRADAADEVLPAKVAAVAADEDEKEVLAGAAMAAAGDLTAAGKEVVEAGPARPAQHLRGRHMKRKKKPWLNRKLESFFKPYSEQYHVAGYFLYKGCDRMGKRVERGAANLSKHLDAAIRDVGNSALHEGERLFAKWVKFFGVVAFLSVVLLPLPNVHLTITAG